MWEANLLLAAISLLHTALDAEMSNLTPSVTTSPEFRKLKGRTLTRLDSEQKVLASGPLGPERLLLNIALDFMERHPDMRIDQAVFAAQAYCDRAHG